MKAMVISGVDGTRKRLASAIPSAKFTLEVIGTNHGDMNWSAPPSSAVCGWTRSCVNTSSEIASPPANSSTTSAPMPSAVVELNR